MTRKMIDIEKVKELHSIGLNDNEIARALKASINGVRYVRKDKLGLPHNIKTYTITPEMDAIIVGTLVGDAWVGYVHSKCAYPKYQVTHCMKQETYTLVIYDKLRSIMTGNIYYGKPRVIDFPNGKYRNTGTVTIASHNAKELIKYRKSFYPEGRKLIPIRFLENRFTDISLAYWYMDDGSFDINSKSFIFNTQAYTDSNLKEFVSFLDEKFNLKYTIKRGHSLYLRHESNELFVSLVNDYITKDLTYKLGRPKTP